MLTNDLVCANWCQNVRNPTPIRRALPRRSSFFGAPKITVHVDEKQHTLITNVMRITKSKSASVPNAKEVGHRSSVLPLEGAIGNGIGEEVNRRAKEHDGVALPRELLACKCGNIHNCELKGQKIGFWNNKSPLDNKMWPLRAAWSRGNDMELITVPRNTMGSPCQGSELLGYKTGNINVLEWISRICEGKDDKLHVCAKCASVISFDSLDHGFFLSSSACFQSRQLVHPNELSSGLFLLRRSQILLWSFFYRQVDGRALGQDSPPCWVPSPKWTQLWSSSISDSDLVHHLSIIKSIDWHALHTMLSATQMNNSGRVLLRRRQIRHWSPVKRPSIIKSIDSFLVVYVL